MSVVIAAGAAGRPDAEPTDAAIVREMQAGDDRRFPIIHHRYDRRLFAMNYACLKDHNDAEEVKQRTWYIFISRLQHCDPERDLWNWLRGIAEREQARYLRRDKRKQNVPIRDEDEVVPAPLTVSGPARQWRQEMIRVVLDRMLEHLPAPMRRAVEGPTLEGASLVEIAREFGVCPATVRSWRRRALARMRLEFRAWEKMTGGLVSGATFSGGMGD